MAHRVIDVSNVGARLRSSLGRLVISRDEGEDACIPFAEIAVIVLGHPQITLTQPVLAGLAEAGAVLVACDSRRLPCAMQLPLIGHFVQTERIRAQAAASLPTRKRLWRDIVKAKIQAQAQVLIELRTGDEGLLSLASRVQSGDTQNVEAQAARRYWASLFPSSDFKRNIEGDDQNRLLNYGYAVLRAIVARAVCAAGLQPSLGLHHRNRYNPFCLVDDLMEPFRPVVDRAVAVLVDRDGADVPLDSKYRRAIADSLLGVFSYEGEERTLFDVAARMAVSLSDVFLGQRRTLTLPKGVVIDADQWL